MCVCGVGAVDDEDEEGARWRGRGPGEGVIFFHVANLAGDIEMSHFSSTWQDDPPVFRIRSRLVLTIHH